MRGVFGTEVIGPVPEGARANFYVSGGEATGPRVHGKIHPVGGDWLTVRTDGVGILDVRATFETRDEGALIYLSYTGVGDLGEDGYERFLRGELPESVPLRVAQRYVTAHPRITCGSTACSASASARCTRNAWR